MCGRRGRGENKMSGCEKTWCGDVETSEGSSRPVGPRCEEIWRCVLCVCECVVCTRVGIGLTWPRVWLGWCVRVWSVPTWELDSRGLGCGLVGVKKWNEKRRKERGRTGQKRRGERWMGAEDVVHDARGR